MLTLKPNQICPYSSTCPYNNGTTMNFCKGSDKDRTYTFNCSFVDEKGIFNEGKFRSKLDETGNMKILMENNGV